MAFLLLSSPAFNAIWTGMLRHHRLRDITRGLTPANFAANTLAGLVASLVTIAYCVAFSALLFQGELASGLAVGLWGLLVGSAIAGIYISLTTTLPPAEAAPDNPAVAVLSVLAATVAAPLLAGGSSPERVVMHVLLAFTLATFLTGLALYVLGRFKLTRSVRFVPYPVIGGFLAASGWLLIVGGFEIIFARDITLANASGLVSPEALPKVAVGLGFVAAVHLLKRWLGSYVLPIAFFGGAVMIDFVLWRHGLMTTGSGWYIPGSATPEPWVPLHTAVSGAVDWSVFLAAAPEIAAIAGVTVLTLLLDVTSLEVARGTTADLDTEFRTNGIANMLQAPAGGLMGNLSMNGSRLLDETGGLQRISGLIAAFAVVVLVITGVDLPAYIPAPILAGLLIYLGLVVLTAVLLHSPAYRAWMDLALALLIMVAIINAGYLTGVILGFVASCLMFAFSYSRVAVIHRHLTRAEFASNVDRAPHAGQVLRDQGERIHIFWLAGFIFFGSSNGVLEQIRAALPTGAAKRRYAVLDVSGVSGFDTSAMLSFIKLRNHCGPARLTMAIAGATPHMIAALRHVGVFDSGEPHRSFASRNDAVEWCEDQLLQTHGIEAGDNAETDLQAWLAQELGCAGRAIRIATYFTRRDLPAGCALYSQDTPSDTIDLVVSGSVAVIVDNGRDLPLLIRRMSRNTVVGEMGFFRGNPRRATVSVEGRSVIYTLTRDAYARLQHEDPALAGTFLEFIIRALSDRLEFANRGIAALS
jgi:SulP family sulfate permease